MFRFRRFGLLALLTACGLLVALVPIASSPYNTLGATTMSIGSRDAPDYALGGRFFLEEGQGVPGKIWGGFEEQGYVNFWRQLNHFGAAALLAMAAATFRLEMWQLITVLACALGACGAGLVVALGQRVFGLRGWLVAGCGLLYALSPLWLHGAYNASIGQMVGTLGASFFLLLALTLPRGGTALSWVKRLGAGTLGLWLLVSTYPMMILFVWAIVGGAAVWRWIQFRRWNSLGALVGWSVATAALCTLLFAERMLAVASMVIAYGGGGDGWSMSPMLLSSVFGLNLGHVLHPKNYLVNVVAEALLGLIWAFGVVAALRRKDPTLGTVVTVCGVILGAAHLLYLRDPADQMRNTYKAYKLVSVFLPILLPALLIGVKASLNRRAHQVSIAVVVLMVTVGVPHSLYAMANAGSALPLRVTPGLIALRSQEKSPKFKSVNITTEEAWYSLWAAAFLAQKEILFTRATYGHPANELTGEWTFEQTFRGFYPVSALQLGNGTVLRPTREPAQVLVNWGIGWWEDERDHRWSGSRGRFFSFILDTAEPVTGVSLVIDGEYLVPGTKVHASIGTRELQVYQSRRGTIMVVNVDLEAGTTEIRFRAEQLPTRGKSDSDQRELLLNVRDVEIAIDGESVARTE
jgi:hypothetical protein